MLNPHVAEQMLEGHPLAVCAEASLSEIKRLRQECLEADIPAAIGSCPGSGKG